jgi:UDP-N-acetyl-D-mannosaminuronic acid dehydrogenase
LSQKAIETISVIGLGYIGLPTAALFASRGYRVLGVDSNKEVVATVSQGKIHIVEPDLDGLVQKAVSSGKLTASTTIEPADAFIIAVPTPITEDHRPDLSYIETAVSGVAPVLKKGDLVIIESTIPVGTTERVSRRFASCRPDLKFPTEAPHAPDIFVAHCPERVLPGRVLTELVNNDRSIGGITTQCTRMAAELYLSLMTGNCFETTARTAELVKLTENAFRDVNIAFANEISLICQQLGVDVWDVISLANRHPRVKILNPGPGVGGHCIAIDPWFIVHSAPAIARLIRTAREVNDSKPQFVIEKVNEAVERNKKAQIACLGLSFKANVDDLRHSPALEIAEKLARTYGERVIAAEPFIKSMPQNLKSAGARWMDALSAIDEADIVVLLVDHRQFRMIDPKQLQTKTIIDTRGLWHGQL